MELTYQNALLMPAAYAVLSEEEMMYVNGGAITSDQVKAFAINFTHNAIMAVGSVSLSMGLQFLTNSVKDAGSLSGGFSTVGAAIGGLNGWGKVALVGCGLCATYYVAYQAYQIYQLVKTVVNSVQQAYDQTIADMNAQQAIAA